jgi:hypothetical protein
MFANYPKKLTTLTANNYRNAQNKTTDRSV